MFFRGGEERGGGLHHAVTLQEGKPKVGVVVSRNFARRFATKDGGSPPLPLFVLHNEQEGHHYSTVTSVRDFSRSLVLLKTPLTIPLGVSFIQLAVIVDAESKKLRINASAYPLRMGSTS